MSLDVSPGFMAFVDVVLHGLHIAGMRDSFLRRMPGPLLALSQILLQASGPFHRMFPHRLATAYQQPKDTACAYHDLVHYPEGGRTQ